MISQTLALDDCFEFVRNGMNIRQSKEANGLPITRIETISDGVIDLNRVGYAGLEGGDAEKWILQPGDILFSHINSVEHVGKCALYEGSSTPLVHGMNLLCLRPKQEILYPQYAKWTLKSAKFRSKILPFINKAVNQASLSTKNLKSIEILVPPFDEQKRIAAILDQANALRRLRQHAIDRLNTLGQAMFHEMFNGASISHEDFRRLELSEVIQKGDKINYGVVQPGDAVEDGVPLVRVGDLLKPLVNKSELKIISKSIEEKYSRSRLNGDEILVACVGSIGAIALADSSMSGFNIARAVARLPVDETKANKLFLAEQLKTQRVQRYFLSETRAVAQPTLNIKQLKETEIFLPPMKQQIEFAERLSGLRDHLSIHSYGLKRLETLFAALQNRAFQGEL